MKTVNTWWRTKLFVGTGIVICLYGGLTLFDWRRSQQAESNWITAKDREEVGWQYSATPSTLFLLRNDQMSEQALDVAADLTSYDDCRVSPVITSKEALAAAVIEVTSMGGVPLVLEKVFEAAPDFQVVVEPLRSSNEARRVRQELIGQEIESHVITNGALRNGVSIGLYSDEKLAEGRRQRVSKLGYQVAVSKLERTHVLFRMVLDKPLIARPFEARWRQWVSCNAVAVDGTGR